MAADWEKLQKLKRDYPKAKFAISEITRQRKKRPTDPYLLVWQADVSLQLQVSPSKVISDFLEPLLQRQPPILDIRLLAHIYELYAKAKKKASPDFVLLPEDASLGSNVQKAWENAAKAHHSRRYRLDLWSSLFTCAMKEEYWEDVRWSLVQATKEGVKSKKTTDFTMTYVHSILGARPVNKDKPAQGVQIQAMLAYTKMKNAFLNAEKPDEPIKVENIRDLRFMAHIFRKQNRQSELVKFWNNAQPTLKEKLDQNYVEVSLLKLELLREQGLCDEAYDLSKSFVQAALKTGTIPQDPQVETLMRSSELWSHLIETVKYKQFDDTERDAEVKALLKMNEDMPFKGREMELTALSLAQQLYQPLLYARCEQYWLSHCHLNSCFHDLRRFVEEMPLHEQQTFHGWITETTRSMHREPGNERAFRRWLQIEVNVLKFDYLLTISNQDPDTVHPGVVEDFVSNALRLYSLGAQIDDDCYHDPGFLAIEALLFLHTHQIHEVTEENDLAKNDDPNSRLLLQAGFLSLHVTAGEKGRQKRPLLLHSTRLHLHLGLGTIAFAQYNLVKVKEILHDTLSHHLLTRISQTHPFESKGFKGFSPDAELSKVISTIQRMESRVDDFVYISMEDFLYDQADELLDFKVQLRSSLSKHLCMIERRRIARLKREPVDSSFDISIKDYYRIRDSRDSEVIQSIHPGDSKGPSPLLWHNDTYQPLSWIYERLEVEEIYRLVFKEIRDDSAAVRLRDDLFPNRLPEGHREDCLDYTELGLLTGYVRVKIIFGLTTEHPDSWNSAIYTHFAEVERELQEMQTILAVMQLPDRSSAEPADDLIMPLEKGLMYLFGHLEFLQLVWKLCDHTTDLLKKSTSRLKAAKVKNEAIDKCRKEVENVYTLIRNIASSHMKALKQRGVKSILAQVRWGPTGAALRELMTDDHQRRYAQDYVESAVEALVGVLLVKYK